MARRRSDTEADPVTAYAADVAARRIVAGPWVRKACARHLRDLREAKRRGLAWRLDLAHRAIDFFPDMLVLESGEPFHLLPWQQFIVGSLFGWYNRDGYRRFRTAYVETGKGSGKTPLAAGLGLYGLTSDGQPAAEIYSAATVRDQAAIVFRDAKRMRASSPDLSELIEDSVGALAVPGTFSTFKPVSSEHRGLDGKRVHIAIIDELHEHPNSMVVDKMRAGTKAQRNALIFEITNSGYDRESVCYRHREYSEKVLDDVFENERWFAYVCALDEGDDWVNPSVWPKANPSLGVTIPESYLREQVEEALGMPTKQNIVKRLNFCIWTEQSSVWMPMDKWDGCGGDIDVEALRGRTCYAGLDLSQSQDMSALVLYFPGAGSERDIVLPYFWIPRDGILDRERTDHAPYSTWVDEGHLFTCPGEQIDFDFIIEQVATLASEEGFVFREIAFDRWGATPVYQKLTARGFTMVQFGQGYESMNGPTVTLGNYVALGKLNHGGHPVLRWNASNMAVEQGPRAAVKPSKRSSKSRIDGIVALIMAMARATVAEAPRESEYERRAREEAAQLADPARQETPETTPEPAPPPPDGRRSVYDSPEWQETFR